MKIRKVTRTETVIEEDDEEIALKKQKIAKLKTVFGIICISIAVFVFFVPFTFSSLPLPYVIFGCLMPVVSIFLLIFIIPKNPVLYLFLFYSFCVIVWFFVLNNFSILVDMRQGISIKAEYYFIFLFPLFVGFFVLGNYLYSKNSDFYAYAAILSLVFLFWVR